MNKEQFIKELSFLLQDISTEDRDDAIYYYEDYFAEAGKENEEKVIRELQSPERVAAIIKAGLNSSFEENIEYSESGMKNSGYDKPDEIVVNGYQEEYEEKHDTQDEKQYQQARSSGFQGDQGRNRILLLIIIGMVCLFSLPFFGAGFAVFASVFVVLFGLGIVFCALGIASMATAIVFITRGLSLLSIATGAGLISIGIGILCIGFALFLFMNVKWPFKIVPNIVRGIVDAVRTIVTKVGERL